MIKYNILIALPTDSPYGGAEGVLRQIAVHYAKKGCEVYVLFLTRMSFEGWKELYNMHNVHFYCSKSGRELGGVLPMLWTIAKRLHKIKFDYVFATTAQLIGFLGLLKRMKILRTKYFVGRECLSVFLRFSGNELIFQRFYHWIGYRVLDILVCQTEEMKSQFVLGTPSVSKKIKSIVVIPNPVNKVEMRIKGAAPIDLTLPSGNYIVAAGRFVWEKGFDLLINAFALLTKEPFADNLFLLILGDGNDRAKYEAIIRRKKLNGRVLMPGVMDNVYPFFRKAILCVISSRLEGFPNVLLQMMSQCNNVVSTTCAGGIDEIKGLLTCPPDDEIALYDVMKKALKRNDSFVNRSIYEEELEKRSIENFIKSVEVTLKLQEK